MDTPVTPTTPASLPNGLSRRRALRLLGAAGLVASRPAPPRATAAPATPAPGRLAANAFQLAGEGVTISYSTGGYVALPRFAFEDERRDVSFGSLDIHTQPTRLGTLVSVGLPGTVDQGDETMTLLLPEVELPGYGGAAALETLAIVTRRLTTIGGQLATYRAIALTGSATWVG